MLISTLGQHRERFNSTSDVNITIIVVMLYNKVQLSFSSFLTLALKSLDLSLLQGSFFCLMVLQSLIPVSCQGMLMFTSLVGRLSVILILLYEVPMIIDLFPFYCFKPHCDLHNVKNQY